MFGRSWVLGAAIVLLGAGTALAGDNNTLYLTQASDGGTLGNSFYSDQSQSNGNSIFASQSGSGNATHIVTSGTAANSLCSGGLDIACNVRVTQDNAQNETGHAFTAEGELVRNYVSVNTAGNSSATVTQSGDGNSATLDILNGSGTVNQSGNNNTAALTVENGTIGTIIQNNGGNSAALQLSGVPGAAATLTQNGGQGYSGPFVVNTLSPVPVTITQN